MKAVLALGLLFAVVHGATVSTLCTGCAFQGQSKYSPAVTVVNPSPSNTLIMMNRGEIYRSIDSGKTWNNVFNGATRMIPAPSNPLLIYLTGFQNLLNYTNDGGQTFHSSQVPIPVNKYYPGESFIPHPYQDGWVMLNGWQGDSDKYCTIYVTKDYGASWTPYFQNITLGRSGRWGNSTTEPDLIWLQALDKSFGYSTDYSTYHKLFDNVYIDDTKMTRHYQFVSVNAKAGSALVDLYVSSNRVDPTHTRKADYRVAEFPFKEDIGVNKFYYLDDITDSEFLAVHQDILQGWVSIFSSGPYGASYRLSIDEVVSNSAGINVDFDRFRGMPGVYLVNTIRDRQNPSYVGPTKITWDNGGSWNYLQVPATDMNGQPWSCTIDCHLILAGPISSTGVQAWHTSSEAIGMVLANGMVGRYLDNTPLSTFYSRDSGVTWTQVLPVASYFAFGNRGSVIVAAPRQTQGNFVYYSLDEATTWTQVQIAGDTQTVNFLGVTAHPNGTGFVFLIHGNVLGSTSAIWVLDLTDVQPRVCTQADFENYVPHDPYDSSNCFMGSLTIYNRKKKSVSCYIPPGVEVITSQVPCPCTFEDYECAFNFDASPRNSSGGFTCTRNGPDRTDCEPGMPYNKPTPQGYVLVPDTNCQLQGGLNLLGEAAVCPQAKDNTGGGGGVSAAAVIIPLLLAGIIIAIVVAYKKNEAFYNWVQSLRGGQSTSQYGRVNNDDVEGLLN